MTVTKNLPNALTVRAHFATGDPQELGPVGYHLAAGHPRNLATGFREQSDLQYKTSSIRPRQPGGCSLIK